MHVVPEELKDCSSLLDYILKVCDAEEIRDVLFLGDQHHTHSVVRLEVLHWWRNAFIALKTHGIKAICLVGNHDQASPGSSIHAMEAYMGMPNVQVVHSPTVINAVALIPYIHTEKEFLEQVKRFESTDARVPGSPPTLICHQTFNGSQYEGGFLASDGFDPNLLSQELVISGHIHTGQEFGRVWYPGSPRWRTLSDADTDRAIWKLEFSAGQLVDRVPYSTAGVCRMIRRLVDTPKDPVQVELVEGIDWRVDIKGPPAWCEQRLELFKGKAKVRCFPEAVALPTVRESEGVPAAFRKFMAAYTPKGGTPLSELADLVKERVHV